MPLIDGSIIVFSFDSREMKYVGNKVKPNKVQILNKPLF